MPSDDLTGAYRDWTPGAQQKALEALQAAAGDQEWRPFYCENTACSGSPHDRWQWNHARADQRPPTDPDWLVWAICGGRGAGKTASVSRLAHKVSDFCPRIAFVAPTGADLRDVVVEGESGLLATAEPGNRPVYEPSKRRVTWPRTGAQGFLYCASDDTEALTPRGWVTHDSLTVGDLVRALDMTTGMACWSTVSAVNVFSVEDEPMASTEMQRHSSLVTGNHRWPVRRKDTGTLRWRESIWDFSTKDGIITSALSSDEGTDDDVAFAALVGWYTTEGCLYRKTEARRASGTVVQCPERNPDNCVAIREVLTEVYGPAVTSLRGVRDPAWRVDTDRLMVFRLNHEAMSRVLAVCPGKDKVVDIEYISGLTSRARSAFLDAVSRGDGWQDGGSVVLAQKVAARLDAVEVAAALEGFGTSRTRTFAGTEMAVLRWGRTMRSDTVVPYDSRVDHREVKAYTGVVWCPTTDTGTWLARRNGTIFYTGNSGEEPERLRGPQHGWAFMDEAAIYPLISDVWDNLMFGLRLGKRPRVVVATTPKPKPWLKDLLKQPTTRVTRVSTYANLANLAPTFADAILKKYEGTRIGRQELHAEILEDVEGALWTWDMIESCRVAAAPPMRRVVVAVDPAGTSRRTSDETGIVVSGLGEDGLLYVLADRSGRYSPDGWARAVMSAYEDFDADSVVVETNYGGDMVVSNLRAADAFPRIVEARARRGKALRAEPVVGRYERGEVKHVGAFPLLEEQLTTWLPYEAAYMADDRLDAAVYSLTALTRVSVPASLGNPSHLRLVV